MYDIVRPLKAYMPDYKFWETCLQMVVMEKYGLLWREPESVKAADTAILFNEQAALLNPSLLEWGLTGEPLPNVKIRAWSPRQAERHYLQRFHQLTGGVYKTPAIGRFSKAWQRIKDKLFRLEGAPHA